MNAALPTVLVAEDSPGLLSATRELLVSWGFDVTAATDGRSAVDAAIEQCPRVAILDLNLPVLDGVAAARAIRSECETPPLLVALTGERRAVPDPNLFDHHLLKPVDLDRLRKILEPWITETPRTAVDWIARARDIFLEEAPVWLQRADAAIAQENEFELTRAAHTLGSMLRAVTDDDAVAATADRLELLAEARRWDDAPEALRNLEQAIAAVSKGDGA